MFPSLEPIGPQLARYLPKLLSRFHLVIGLALYHVVLLIGLFVLMNWQLGQLFHWRLSHGL